MSAELSFSLLSIAALLMAAVILRLPGRARAALVIILLAALVSGAVGTSVTQQPYAIVAAAG